MITFTATYSPDDNKLRLTASARLDAKTYARVKAAGFAWAPKQEQFIAPMWTPGRAELCLDLAGEIDDDDGSLVDRAEVRAERFSGYQAKRGAESERAAEHVRQIADGIPMGQPILVGHHSEAHARRDAKRIESGMQRAVDLFDTAQYWRRRAAGAIAHAKYKERADVRHRRIKGLESDQRKHQKDVDEARALVGIWEKVPRIEWDEQTRRATFIAGRTPSVYVADGTIYGVSLYTLLSDGRMHGDTAWRVAIAGQKRRQAYALRWLDHIANRLEYERAMMADGGGLAAEAFDIQPGGRVLIGAEWCLVIRVNRGAGGKVASVTTNARYVSIRGIEEIQDYRAPDPEEAAKLETAKKLAPLCNYRTAECREMTSEEWKRATRHNDSYFVEKVNATADAVAHRRRSASTSAGAWVRVPVFLTDAKETRPPAPGTPTKGAARGPWNSEPREAARAAPITFARQIEPAALPPATQSAPPATHSNLAEIEAMRASLRSGVQVVSAPQLFPTPPTLAARMVEMAGVQRLERVLEPSAGTGRILQALADVLPLDEVTACAWEINSGLAGALQRQFKAVTVRSGDFLAVAPASVKLFDRILMNPPFERGADVEHVTHAVSLLAPGGRLVAIMSAGIEFRDDRRTREFRALVERMDGYIEKLPPGSFDASGTGVNVVLVVLETPPCAAERAAA